MSTTCWPGLTPTNEVFRPHLVPASREPQEKGRARETAEQPHGRANQNYRRLLKRKITRHGSSFAAPLLGWGSSARAPPCIF